MARARRRGRQAGAGPLLLGVFLIVAALALAAAGGWLYWQADRAQVVLDAKTMCPVQGTQALIAVLIDRTDPYTRIQQADIEKALLRIEDSVPCFGALAVYTVGDAPEAALEPRVMLCNPGRGTDIDPLLGNPQKVERRWRSSYDQALRQAFDQLMSPGQAGNSPLLEAIQAISVGYLSIVNRPTLPRRLVIVSDMLQHVAEYSHYRTQPDFKALRASGYYRRVHADLRDVSVEILLARRDGAEGHQGKKLIDFWQEYFADQGAVVDHVLLLQG